MPKFSKGSLEKLATVDQRLADVAFEAIKTVDFKVIVGHRGKLQQDEAFAKGFSKLRYPKSNHNKFPSRAFDFIPWPFRGWEAKGINKDFERVAAGIKAAADRVGVKIVWGGDWKTFVDRPHIELHKSEEVA